jgi:hypothetical protein
MQHGGHKRAVGPDAKPHYHLGENAPYFLRRTGGACTASGIPDGVLALDPERVRRWRVKQLNEVLQQMFEDVSPVKESRRWELQQRWRTTFASQLDSWAGPLRDCSWHALSYGLLASLRGADAIEEFERRMSCGAVILATEEPSLAPTYRAVSTRAVTHRELSAGWLRDLYLISEDWSWSFVMTHEQGILGPYFVEGIPDDRVAAGGD